MGLSNLEINAMYSVSNTPSLVFVILGGMLIIIYFFYYFKIYFWKDW